MLCHLETLILSILDQNLFFFKLYLFYNTVLVLPYINMNLPRVYLSSHSWTPLPPPPHTISLGHPSAPAPSILYPASNLDWQFISYMILYMFQCHSPKSSRPLPLPHLSVQFTQSCPTLCDPIDSSRLVFPVHHQLPDWCLLKLIPIESVMPSNHFIFFRPLLLPPSIFPSIKVFSNKSVLHIRWPKYWSFSFSISSSNEYSRLISFRVDWFFSPCCPKDSQEYSLTPQFKSINLIIYATC